jgi:hypothetical protein
MSQSSRRAGALAASLLAEKAPADTQPSTCGAFVPDDQLPKKIVDNRNPTGTHMNKTTMTTSIGSNMVIPSTLVDVH